LSVNPSIISRWWALPLILVVSTAMAAVLVFVFAAVIVYPTLPTLDKLTDYREGAPARVQRRGPTDR
jgi:penicillin-binding protein 1A